MSRIHPIVLQINATANWGSTGKIAESIGVAILNHGWRSIIAYGRWNNPSLSCLVRVGSWSNKYFHFAEQRVRDNEGLCSRIATRRLIKKVDKIKPDVVQLHNIHDHFLNYRLLFRYLNQTDIKVVWTFHDCWAFTGHCFHFVTKDCDRWETGCYSCPMKSVLPKTFLDRSKKNYELKQSLFCGNKNLTVVPVSEWMAGFVRKSFLKDNRIEVIKNGIDLNVFKPIGEEEENDFYDILAVSSVWSQEKGLYDIFKLRSLLSDDYRITIVGLSEKQVKELPVGIIGIQRTQDVDDLVRLYSNSNILINPTYADTFPTVNLEALACGTPVITYDTGGSPETIDADTGIVVKQGDVSGMVEAIKSICSKGREHYSFACRRRAEMHFEKNNCYKKYIYLYEDLLARSEK